MVNLKKWLIAYADKWQLGHSEVFTTLIGALMLDVADGTRRSPLDAMRI
jgi:hypothetical protein